MKRTRIKKQSKSNVKVLQRKCDSLLTPIIKIKTPLCEACSQPTQVAHHFIEKSRSNRLRYDFDNLIALCNQCHCKIHNRFGNSVVGGLDVADKIRERRGEDWYENIKIKGREIVKTDITWYEDNYKRLGEMIYKIPTFKQ